MNPLAWIEAKAWQIGTFAAGALCIVLLLSLAVQRGELSHARDALAAEQKAHALDKASLKTCNDNVDGLVGAIDRNNAAMAKWQQQSDATLSAADKAAVVARRNAAAAQTTADMLKAHVPVGNDVCSRVLDSDAAFLESIK